MPTVNDTLLAAIRARSQKQSPYSEGIIIADRYVKTLLDCVGSDVCNRFASTKSASFHDALTKAASTLTYHNPDMGLDDEGVVWEKVAGTPREVDGIEIPKNTLMVFKHVLTTPRKDRDGDVLRTQGAQVDPKMLLLWQHVHTLPIGKMLKVAEQNSKVLRLYSCIVDMNALSHDSAVMIDNKMGRFSHGFRAIEFEEMKEHQGDTTSPGGFDVKQFEIMEESLVSVPSNTDAQVDEIILDLVEGGKLTSPLMKAAGRQLREHRNVRVPVVVDVKVLVNGKEHDDGKQADGATEGTTKTPCGCGASKSKEAGADAGQADGAGAAEVKGGPGSGPHPGGGAHVASVAASKLSEAVGGIAANEHAKLAEDASAKGDHGTAAREHRLAAAEHAHQNMWGPAGGWQGSNTPGKAESAHLSAARLHDAEGKSVIPTTKHPLLTIFPKRDFTMKIAKMADAVDSRDSVAAAHASREAHNASMDATDSGSAGRNLSQAGVDAAEQAVTKAKAADTSGDYNDAAASHREAVGAHEDAAAWHDEQSGKQGDDHHIASNMHLKAADTHEMVAAKMRGRKSVTAATKEGRVMSAAGLSTLKTVHTDMTDLHGNGYGMNKGGHAICEKCIGTMKKIIDVATPEGGGVSGGGAAPDGKSVKLAQEHKMMLKEVHTDLTDLHGQGYGMNKEGHALCAKCVGGMAKLVKDMDVGGGEGDPDPGGEAGFRTMTAKEAGAAFLAIAKPEEVATMKSILAAVDEVAQQEKRVEDFRALTGVSA